MLTPSEDVLLQLKCAHCRGYLNTTPVMVRPNNSQICGKCFNILPLIAKRECVRQVGYEAVVPLFLFPCRYNLQGCRIKFGVNEADSHELECPFRFNEPNLYALEDEGPLYEDVELLAGSKSIETEASECKSSDAAGNIVVESAYELIKSRELPKLLKYKTKISGNLNERKVHLEGAISLAPLRSVCCQVTLNDPNLSSKYENDAQTTEGSTNFPKCAKCFKIVKSEIYHCAFGHDVCRNCKGNTCSLCTTPISSVPRYSCENISKGCCIYLLSTEVYLHSRDCEFRDFECLQKGCGDVSQTLFALKNHIKEAHSNSAIASNLVLKQTSDKDETWIMQAHDNLFNCKRFCYEADLEFMVVLVGPHRHAENFKFEICIKNPITNRHLTKIAGCLGWNVSALDRGMTFARNEIAKAKINSHNFAYTLKIIKMLKE